MSPEQCQGCFLSTEVGALLAVARDKQQLPVSFHWHNDCISGALAGGHKFSERPFAAKAVNCFPSSDPDAC